MPRLNRRTTLEAPMNVDIPVDVAEDLDAFCDRTRLKKKRAVELALRRFLAAEAKKVGK